MNTNSPELVNNPEQNGEVRLSAALKTFEGTPIAPLIVTSLEAAGYDPSTYDPEDARHDHYRGYPTDSSIEADGSLHSSPIIVELEKAIEEGKILVDHPPYDYEQLHIKPDTDPYGRLSHIVGVNILVLKDSQTTEPLAYAVGLSSDGGRRGHALISVNDVIAKSEDVNESLDARRNRLSNYFSQDAEVRGEEIEEEEEA